MKTFMKLPIFGKIYGFSIFLISLMGLIVLFSYLSVDKLKERENAINLKGTLVKIRNFEKDFVSNREITNVDSVRQELEMFRFLLSRFENSPYTAGIEENIERYGREFELLKNTVVERGLNENSGAEGELRESVHKIEEIVLAAGIDKVLIDMLYARRSEKDFIMRRKPKYIEKVKKAVEGIKSKIEKSGLTSETKSEVIILADDYFQKFNSMAKKMLLLEGLNQRMETISNNLHPQLDDLIKLKLEEAKEYELLRIIVIVVTVLLSLCLAYFIGKVITRPIKKLQMLATEISSGNYTAHVEVKALDEIGELAKMLNLMADKIRGAREELIFEKQNVEKKVENAIAKSEEQKEYLARSIENILGEMQRFENGDMTVSLKVDTDDDIGRLFSGFNSAAGNIRSMLIDVENAVNNAVSGSYEIVSKSGDLSRGSCRQSEEVDEIATSIERMTSKIIETSSAAGRASEFAGESVNIATDGGKVVAETLDGMKSLALIVSESAEKVITLGKSSSKIGTIVKVIDDIADQTNLLALNAAIEAARAGEHGRGFAVVADEVRKLAEKTSGATKEIASMIKQIQTETSHVVEIMNTGKQTVEEDLAGATRAGESLNLIIESSQKLVELINTLAKANDEQTTEAAAIAGRIEIINRVAGEAVSGNEEITAKSAELRDLMNNLQTLVEGFVIHEDNQGNVSGCKSYKYSLAGI